MQHLGTRRIETERLVLRPFTTEDAQAMYDNWASDAEVVKYLTWPVHKSADASRELLTMWVAEYEKPETYQWAICLREQGEMPIGSISVVNHDDRTGRFEIGYCIGRAWWRQGIMPEALRAVIHYLFTKVGVNRVEARFDPNNAGSGRVMQKCGMTCEGTRRQSDWNNQGLCDATMYAILRQEYANQ